MKVPFLEASTKAKVSVADPTAFRQRGSGIRRATDIDMRSVIGLSSVRPAKRRSKVKQGTKPPNCPWVSPYLTVRSAEAALDFYQRAFGFETRLTVPGPEGKIGHAEMTWRDGLIMIGPECPSNKGANAPAASKVRSPVTMYVYCDDVDALFARARAAGATAEEAPQDMFWGDRMCRLVDPDGHIWCFATWSGKAFQPGQCA
jgi:uncharacterized glyoxalase superfamily protein PhnB